MSAKRYYLETFGCQMNTLDSELVMGQLRGLGYERTEHRRRADLILYNTCSVREHAEHKVWSRLGEVAIQKKRRPDLIVGVLGCMAQEWQAEILTRAPEVDLVLGTREVGRVGRAVQAIERDRAPIVEADLTRPVSVERDIHVREHRHSAYVTVMYGCDFGCTYCIVPRTRGVEESRPVAEVKGEVERLAADGVREVTLLGQTVDSYGKTLPGRPDLGDLLEAIHDTPGLERIRFITSHPSLMREPILRRMGTLPKVCEYLHIPAQSGSDRILKAMRRGYTADRYREICARARELVPNVSIASDFIVGYPGETDDDFADTLRLVEEMRFGQAYVFKYSPRPGTPAWGTADDVPEATKRERNQRLLTAQEKVQLAANRALIGSRQQVLVEGASRMNEATLAGRNRQNRIVVFRPERTAGPTAEGAEPRSIAASDLVGALVDIEVTDATAFALYGRLPGGRPLYARPEDAAAREADAQPAMAPTAPKPAPIAAEGARAPRLRPLPMA